MLKSAITISLLLTVFTPAAARAGYYESLGAHPNASHESTAASRILAALHGYNNKIYVGYGDYGANTGPTVIRAWDLSTGDWTPALMTFQTEAIYNYREINGALYAPAIDPDNFENHSYAYTVGDTDMWQEGSHLDIDNDPWPMHVYDIAGYKGDLFVAASIHHTTGGGDIAAIYKSTDSGATWTLDHQVAPAPGDNNRFYGLAVYDGKLWTQADAFSNKPGLADVSQVYDGTSWTTGPSMRPLNSNDVMITHPVAFADKLVYQTYHQGIWMSRAYMFDGTDADPDWILSDYWNVEDATWEDSYFYDYSVDGDMMWVLTWGHHIYTTTDLEHWTLLDTAPDTARSILHYQGELYIGTSDSQLLQYVVPEPTSGALLLLGLGGLLMLPRRRGSLES